MKQILSLIVGVFATLTLASQPPMRPMAPQGPRPLPNQFRDFVDHQQRLDIGRPNIERKDGKVIITLSEQDFKRMQQMRQVQRFRHARFTQQNCCGRCPMNKPRPHRGPRHKKI